MCNQYQNSCCGCRSSRSCGCQRCGNNWQNSASNWSNSGCGCNQGMNDTAMYEAECMMREIEMRRNRENRCARQFTRCLNCNY